MTSYNDNKLLAFISLQVSFYMMHNQITNNYVLIMTRLWSFDTSCLFYVGFLFLSDYDK